MTMSGGPEIFRIEAPGLRCELSSLGASIASLQVPGADGAMMDVALAPLNLREGSPDPAQAGRTIGPCCGRVRGGEIEIDAQAIRLERNAGAHHMHGGSRGCGQLLWRGAQPSPAEVRFELRLPDGLCGYPGNRDLRADYAASEGELRVTYTARTDRPTWLGLTNHVYWDLSGRFDGAALRQRLQVAGDAVVYNDEQGLAYAVDPVAGGPFDFRAPDSVARKRARFPENPHLLRGRGVDNMLLLSAALREEFGFCARLHSPDSGVRMTLDTDAPALVVYSGGFLDGQTRLASGGATPGCAIAIEAEDPLDPFHLPGAVPTILRPGQLWRRTIRWRFDRA